MNKLASLTVSALTAAVLLTGCSTGAAKTDGTFVQINGVMRMSDLYRSDPDAAIESVITEDKYESGETVSLKDGQFSIKQHLDAENTVTWSGSFTSENAALKFSYTDAEVSGKIKADDYTGRIQKLNETGAYPSQIMPQIYLSDAARQNSHMPVFLIRSSKAALSVTEMHGDFLCVPVYGFTVEGSYQSGKDFAVSYVPADTLRNDPYSDAHRNDAADDVYDKEPDEEKLAALLQITANRLGIADADSMQLRVAFSGGKWEMTGSDGSTVSKGSYAESKNHPGFIAMYEEPDDAGKADMLKSFNPLFLYIDGNTVYYPGFVRKD